MGLSPFVWFLVYIFFFFHLMDFLSFYIRKDKKETRRGHNNPQQQLFCLYCYIFLYCITYMYVCLSHLYTCVCVRARIVVVSCAGVSKLTLVYSQTKKQWRLFYVYIMNDFIFHLNFHPIYVHLLLYTPTDTLITTPERVAGCCSCHSFSSN